MAKQATVLTGVLMPRTDCLLSAGVTRSVCRVVILTPAPFAFPNLPIFKHDIETAKVLAGVTNQTWNNPASARGVAPEV